MHTMLLLSFDFESFYAYDIRVFIYIFLIFQTKFEPYGIVLIKIA